LGRTPLGVPVRGAEALVRALSRARPDRSDLAEEYGGAGYSREDAAILAEEMQRLNARPPLVSFGISMLGPALLKFGAAEQKETHLPRIARGEIRWCQGYSEPGAGSDLASLRTRAEDRGDHFLINARRSGPPTPTRPTGYSVWCGPIRRDQAEGYFLPLDRHGDAWRVDQADRADLRQIAVLRDVLRGRRRAEGEPRGRAAPGLGRRQISAHARTRNDRLQSVRHRGAEQGGQSQDAARPSDRPGPARRRSHARRSTPTRPRRTRLRYLAEAAAAASSAPAPPC